MDIINTGNSFYHQCAAIYVCDRAGNLIFINGRNKALVEVEWKSLRAALSNSVDIGNSITKFKWSATKLARVGCVGNVYEYITPESQAMGVVVRGQDDETISLSLSNSLATFILTTSGIKALGQKLISEPCSWDQKRLASKICDIFDETLRYSSTNDQWELVGRQRFLETIQRFTSRAAQIQFCLPAFPCKSSNPEKVANCFPDKGEEMALRQLHEFAEKIEKIYAPGANICLVSDGHVFSDCIGVDDTIVDNYNEALQRMNKNIYREVGTPNTVTFRSLEDRFQTSKISSDIMSQAENFDLSHLIYTNTTPEAELCRKLLLLGFQSNRELLRKTINFQDNGILALYRGFSKFMLEDLNLHPSTKTMSRNQKKKLSSNTAFEMIVRNQAYSNLIELLFPLHVRLSIHAHNNSGPKYGIRLLNPSKCSTIETRMSHPSNRSVDFLYIPTPWHNCVARFSDSETLYMTKSKFVRQGISDGMFKGEWDAKEGCWQLFERKLDAISTA